MFPGYDEFLAEIQRDAELPGHDDAIRAALETPSAAGGAAARPTSRPRR